MSNLLATGVAWLHQQRAAYLAKSVTYRRGMSSVTLSDATYGKTQATIAGNEAVDVVSQIDDWIFDPAGLVLDGEATFPQDGDQIIETSGGQSFVFDVRPFENGECWRYTDGTKLAIRVHTVRAAIE